MTTAAWAAVLLGAAVLVWPASRDPRSRFSGPGAPGRPARETSSTSRWWRRLGAARPNAELVSVLEGLAAALRAGLTPARALQHLGAAQSTHGSPGPAESDDLLGRLAMQAAQGSPLEPVWRREAQVRGSRALLAVAECWALTERHGAPLVDVLDVVVGALRDGARTDAAVEAALAAPRATARLLGVLPLGGLVLGELVGVHPVSVLLGTAAGRVVGLAGLGCTFGGRAWMRRLVAGVSAGPRR